VRRYLGQTGGIRPAPLGRSARQLSAAERDEPSRGLVLGESLRVIGERLGHSHSTVSHATLFVRTKQLEVNRLVTDPHRVIRWEAQEQAMLICSGDQSRSKFFLDLGS
jgi:hypothetical protein